MLDGSSINTDNTIMVVLFMVYCHVTLGYIKCLKKLYKMHTGDELCKNVTEKKKQKREKKNTNLSPSYKDIVGWWTILIKKKPKKTLPLHRDTSPKNVHTPTHAKKLLISLLCKLQLRSKVNLLLALENEDYILLIFWDIHLFHPISSTKIIKKAASNKYTAVSLTRFWKGILSVRLTTVTVDT